MKLFKLFLFVTIFGCLFETALAQNTNPIVSNVHFAKRTDGSILVDVYYDVTDADGNPVTITMLASNDNGTTWTFSCSSVTGNIGAGITSGTNKHIVWNFGVDHPNYSNSQIKIKIIADDGIPDSPVLVSPANNITNLSLPATLSWNAGAGTVVSYTLQIASDTGFASLISNQSGISGTSQQISGLNGLTKYYWRVQAVNSFGNSNWTTKWSFTTAVGGTAPSIPSLASPSNNATELSIPPTLTWNTSTGAVTYTLQVSTSNTFGSLFYSDSTLTGVSKQITGLANSSLYYWRVNAKNSYGTSSWSSVWSFTTISITTNGLIAYYPFNGNANDESGNGHNGIINGVLTSSADRFGLSGKAYNFNGVDNYINTSINTGLTNKATFSVWVKSSSTNDWCGLLASRGSGNDFSGFTVLANGSVNFYAYTNVYIVASSINILDDRWHQLVGRYDGSAMNLILDGQLIGTTSYDGNISIGDNYMIGVDLLSLTRCFKGSIDDVRIYNCALSDTEIQSLYHENGYGITAPTLTSPANNATGVSNAPTLSWGAVSGAVTYNLQVSTDAGFSNLVYNLTGLKGTTQLISGLGNLTQYYWRVNQTNTYGTSTWSSVYSFTTIGVAPGTSTLATPANNTIDITLPPTLTWNASSGAVTYTLQVSTSSSFTSFIFNDSTLNSVSQQISGLANSTIYYWRVNAKNSYGTSSWSSVWSFTTIKSNTPSGFVFVAGGTFIMGDTLTGTPFHSVTLSSYYISKTELTQGQWVSVMGSNPSLFTSVGNNAPVEKVTWFDCINYCNKLSLLEGKTPCYSIAGNTAPSDWTSGTVVCDFSAKGYRLPTEAEWEFAAKGGNKSAGYKYSGSNTMDSVSWNTYNSGNTTHVVSTKKANELGISDMSGNVQEWCWDWYGAYSSASLTNPTGIANGTSRMLRGGSWYNDEINCLPGNRYKNAPDNIVSKAGFRLVLMY